MPLPESDWQIAERVFETFPGGEDAFWLAWGQGELAPETMDWFRRHAADVVVEIEVRAADLRLAAHVQRQSAFTTPEDRRREWAILEAFALAVEAPGTLTIDARDFKKRSELRTLFAEALFGLLEHDLDLDPANWSGMSEAEVGTAVLRVVFPELTPDADDAPPSFVEIAAELRELRERAGRGDTADPVELALRALAAPLLLPGPDGVGYRLEPSFRNYLRSRLRDACRRLGWSPRPVADGGRFPDLDSAFAALTRERVVEAFQEVHWLELDRWLAADKVLNAQ